MSVCVFHILHIIIIISFLILLLTILVYILFKFNIASNLKSHPLINKLN
jgi:ABC-type phosphate/phosphonate transport system permease subunit